MNSWLTEVTSLLMSSVWEAETFEVPASFMFLDFFCFLSCDIVKQGELDKVVGRVKMGLEFSKILRTSKFQKREWKNGEDELFIGSMWQLKRWDLEKLVGHMLLLYEEEREVILFPFLGN